MWAGTIRMKNNAANMGTPDNILTEGPVQESPLWPAFMLGRLLNEIRWRLELAVFFSAALPEDGVENLLSDCVPWVRALLSDPAAACVEEIILDQAKTWNYWATSEYAADTVAETIHHYVGLAKGEDVEEFFDDATELARRIENSIFEALVDALQGHQRVKTAIRLGRLVDRAFRPRDAARYAYRLVLERASNPLQRPRNQVEGRFCERSNEPPSPRWSLRIRKLWPLLGTKTILHQSIYDHVTYALVPGESFERIVESIGEEVRKVLLNGEVASDVQRGLTAENALDAMSADNTAVTLGATSDSSEKRGALGIRSSNLRSAQSDAQGRGEESRRRGRVQSRNPRITKEEAERRVAHFLTDHPNASIISVEHGVSVPRSSVARTEAWKNRRSTIAASEGRSVRTRNLKKSSVESFGSREALSQETDLGDLLEVQLLPLATHGEQSAYRNAPSSEKREVMETILRRIKHELYEHCQNHEDEKVALDRLVSDGNLECVLKYYEQVQERSSERLGRSTESKL